jgi:ring-1,2-phenylacetyl-CoA epoxidase subunit PaaC
MIRLGDGTEESHLRMQNAVNELWIYTGELFHMDQIDRQLLEAGIAVDLDLLRPLWDDTVNRVFTEATLQRPEDSWMREGGKQGLHSEQLGYLLAEMQYLQRAYPGARW